MGLVDHVEQEIGESRERCTVSEREQHQRVEIRLFRRGLQGVTEYWLHVLSSQGSHRFASPGRGVES